MVKTTATLTASHINSVLSFLENKRPLKISEITSLLKKQGGLLEDWQVRRIIRFLVKNKLVNENICHQRKGSTYFITRN